jgi:hypothetical protein
MRRKSGQRTKFEDTPMRVGASIPRAPLRRETLKDL